MPAASPAAAAVAQRPRPARGRGGFAAKGLLSFLARGGNAGSVFVVSALLSRALPPLEFGAFTLAYSATVIGGVALALGAQTSSARLLGEALSRDDRPLLFGVTRAFLRLLLPFWLLAGVAMLLLLAPALRAFDATGAALARATPWLAAWVLLSAARFALAGAFRGARQVVAASVVDGALANGLLALALLGFLAAGRQLDLPGVLLAAVVANLLALAGAVLLLRRSLGPPPAAVTPYPVAGLLRMGLPMLLGSLVVQLTFQMPVWILGAVGDPLDVAHYGAGNQLFQANALVAAVTLANAIPVIVDLHARGEHAALRRFLQNAALGASLPLAALALLFALAGPRIAALAYGKAYAASGSVAALLSIGLAAYTALGFNQIVLTMTGAERAMSLIVSLTTLACAGAIWALYPLGGVAGTAGLVALLLVGQGLWLGQVVRRRLGFMPYAWRRRDA